jgi:RNA polymerase sigma-70 factor, ECF subfamily
LSPPHREIIDLVYYHEKSIDEVAEITGVPQNGRRPDRISAD